MVKVGMVGICLMLLVGIVRVAEAQEIGSWYVDVTSFPKGQTDNIYAATINESGTLFGQFCYPDDSVCYWLLASKTSCADGSSYPVLASSSGAAVHLEIVCKGKTEDGIYRYVFADFETVGALIKSGKTGKIAIVVPLTGGDFTVSRFGLNGALSAIEKMRAVGDKLVAGTKRGTRDTRL